MFSQLLPNRSVRNCRHMLPCGSSARDQVGLLLHAFCTPPLAHTDHIWLVAFHVHCCHCLLPRSFKFWLCYQNPGRIVKHTRSNRRDLLTRFIKHRLNSEAWLRALIPIDTATMPRTDHPSTDICRHFHCMHVLLCCHMLHLVSTRTLYMRHVIRVRYSKTTPYHVYSSYKIKIQV